MHVEMVAGVYIKLLRARVRSYGTVEFLGKSETIIQQPMDKLFEDEFQA